MSIERVDDAPPTVRFHPGTAQDELGDYMVQILYREPGYARKSGTHRSYSGSFLVRARTLAAAIAEAKTRFEQLATQSSVSWIREIERIHGRKLEPGEPREGAIDAPLAGAGRSRR